MPNSLQAKRSQLWQLRHLFASSAATVAIIVADCQMVKTLDSSSGDIGSSLQARPTECRAILLHTLKMQDRKWRTNSHGEKMTDLETDGLSFSSAVFLWSVTFPVLRFKSTPVWSMIIGNIALAAMWSNGLWAAQ